MKILIISNSILPALGGREVVVHYLALALQELGHEVLVVASGGWRHRKETYPYPVRRTMTFGGLLSREGQLLRMAKRMDADVLHAHSTYPSGEVAAYVKAKRPHMPFVVTPHGIDIHTIPEIGHGLRLDPEIAKKIDAVLEASDAVTAISGSVADSVAETDARGVRVVDIPERDRQPSVHRTRGAWRAPRSLRFRRRPKSSSR